MSPPSDIAYPICSRAIGADDELETRQRLGRAIRACREGRATQDEVAERTGIGQSTLSSYEKGLSVPAVLRLWDIERACNRDAGWIVVNAGLVPGVMTVPQAIAIAPELDDTAREWLTRAHRGIVEGYRPFDAPQGSAVDT